jgi:hypothetical protein
MVVGLADEKRWTSVSHRGDRGLLAFEFGRRLYFHVFPIQLSKARLIGDF